MYVLFDVYEVYLALAKLVFIFSRKIQIVTCFDTAIYNDALMKLMDK
jgi:hypothetical protein